MPDHVKDSIKPIEIYKGSIPNKSEPIKHLKYLYRNYSEKDLKDISNDNGYRDDARQAAEELLEEKFKTSS